MSAQEQQEEEIEVLKSIYDGDTNFIEVSATSFQYKVGVDQNYKSFLVEVNWGEEYPDTIATINMELFYNKHLSQDVKNTIAEKLNEQAEMFAGSAVTYTLFEFAKENADELTEQQTNIPIQSNHEEGPGDSSAGNTVAKTKVKKEQLTKAQKRKIVNRLDDKGEVPRGYDWVDIIKHLSQTGVGAQKS